jgi:hypothetical protein
MAYRAWATADSPKQRLAWIEYFMVEQAKKVIIRIVPKGTIKRVTEVGGESNSLLATQTLEFHPSYMLKSCISQMNAMTVNIAHLNLRDHQRRAKKVYINEENTRSPHVPFLGFTYACPFWGEPKAHTRRPRIQAT